MAAVSLQLPLPLSLSPLNPKPPSPSSLSFPKFASAGGVLQSSFFSGSASNGEAKRLVETKVVSRNIEGPRRENRFMSEDYSVKKVSAKQIEDWVKSDRKIPLIVGFYATWCGPCIPMAQELEMLQVEYEDNALFVKVDTDDEYEFAIDMQVRGLPTLYFISPDPKKHAIRTEGLVPSNMIKDIIDNEM
ncbi:hypothetical protein LUZ60_013630 [Juncus effusus]|nr:hypothetical protein LUZ60_013630 [Juncus effusus]